MEENFLESCRIEATQPSVTERYFKPNLISEFNQCVLTHSNRLCIVSLAPSHPILTQNLDVISVEFESVSLLNKVSGKSKRGGQKLNKRSILCSLKCSDGQNFSLHSCSPGKLVEINERLISNPNLIKEKPWTEGYVAIILPPFTSASKRKNNNT